MNKNIQFYNKTMTQTVWESMPQHFETSASNKSGKEELLDFIDELNKKVTENF